MYTKGDAERAGLMRLKRLIIVHEFILVFSYLSHRYRPLAIKWKSWGLLVGEGGWRYICTIVPEIVSAFIFTHRANETYEYARSL